MALLLTTFTNGCKVSLSQSLYFYQESLYRRSALICLYFDYSNGPAWMVIIANSFPIGIIGVWGPVLGVNMKPLDVSQVCCSILALTNRNMIKRTLCAPKKKLKSA